jgi:hypothetical protein
MNYSIKSLDDFLFEKVSKNELYHYTAASYLLDIIKNDTLKRSNDKASKHADSPFKGIAFVSLTSDDGFYRLEGTNVHAECRLVFDKKQLSDNFELKKYSYKNDPGAKWKNVPDENEYRLIMPRGTASSGIKNISDYIIRIDLINSDRWDYDTKGFKKSDIVEAIEKFKKQVSKLTNTPIKIIK